MRLLVKNDDDEEEAELDGDGAAFGTSRLYS